MPTRRPAATGRAPLSGPLRDAVTSRGLSAHALARSAGVDVRAVQRWIRGEKDLTLASADRIASALGVRLVDSGRRGARTMPAGRPANAPVAAELPEIAGELPAPAIPFEAGVLPAEACTDDVA